MIVKVVKYATLLDLFKYSYKSLRELKGPLAEQYLSGALNLQPFFSEAASSFSVPVSAVTEVYRSYYDRAKAAPPHTILEHGIAPYPLKLGKTDSPPRFLFCQGHLDLVLGDCIAVVGSRKASDDALRRARRLAMLLAANGFIVVSGLARGIDQVAHEGAIDAGGKTIGVIGTPLDKSYPKENERLQAVIARSHLLVSQFHFGHQVTRFNFPARNYTMSGLCRATVVVEAAETSGALIQARQCMRQGRHLFILRNVLDRKDLKWPARLVSKGAFVIERIEDVIESLHKIPKYQNGERKEKKLL